MELLAVYKKRHQKKEIKLLNDHIKKSGIFDGLNVRKRRINSEWFNLSEDNGIRISVDGQEIGRAQSISYTPSYHDVVGEATRAREEAIARSLEQRIFRDFEEIRAEMHPILATDVFEFILDLNELDHQSEEDD